MIVGQIFTNDKGRFQVDTAELTAGDPLEVLVVDGRSGQTKWIQTIVEQNGENYFLSGLLGYSPVGLFAKIEL